MDNRKKSLTSAELMRKDKRHDKQSGHHTLETIAQSALELARRQGATQSAVRLGSGEGFTVKIRMGGVDTLEHQRDHSIVLTFYLGQRKASVSSSDIGANAIKHIVEKAYHMAKHTQPDPCHGLADVECMASKPLDLNLYHPWGLTPADAIKIALDCEEQARSLDQRIVNSEGVEIDSHQGKSVYANSHGFIGVRQTTHHSASCVLIAKQQGDMERDWSYTAARDPNDLLSMSMLAKQAVEKTLQRLAPQKIKTARMPVIFTPEVARSLLSTFIAAINGHNLYKKSSFLLDHLNQTVFNKNITIYEEPHLMKGLGSTYFDCEGVATTSKKIVQQGVLQSYCLDSYAARKLKLNSTANAGGVHNLFISCGEDNLPALIKKMHHGLVITELMGQGINLTTGDYSRGACGLFVDHGNIQHPVSGITIADNLKDMYANIAAVGNDIDRNSNIQTGSILIESMMVAGY